MLSESSAREMERLETMANSGQRRAAGDDDEEDEGGYDGEHYEEDS